jgi:hypothetical protein
VRRRRSREGEPPRELDLLVPEAGKSPVIGRKDLLAELQAWLDDDTDISGHALVGRAGTGNTRLALEFCRIIDRDPAAKSEWIAGFLSASDLRAVVETLTTQASSGISGRSWSSTTRPSAIRPWPAGWTGSPTSRMQGPRLAQFNLNRSCHAF